MDVILSFSTLIAAMGMVWVIAALFGALLLGGTVAFFFGSIFFGVNRLAAAWEAKEQEQETLTK